MEGCNVYLIGEDDLCSKFSMNMCRIAANEGWGDGTKCGITNHLTDGERDVKYLRFLRIKFAPESVGTSPCLLGPIIFETATKILQDMDSL